MSPPSFNLVDRPWIPVEDLSGSLREVSLTEFFANAESFRRIVHQSPLVTVALYRFAFAIMNRALRPTSIEDWQDAWDAKSFGGEVNTYLEDFRHRFDLFSEEAPFAQVLDMPAECREYPWTKLALELPPNSSKLLFDHTATIDPPTAAPAEIARVLLAAQAFIVGAGKSCMGYTSHAPLTAALTVLPEGADLAETLLANLMYSDDPADLPIWELSPLTARTVESQVTPSWKGPASRLTWLSRSVRLIPYNESGDVKWIKFAMGLEPPKSESDRDPWVVYRVTKEGTRLPRKLDVGRMVWRDLHAMITAEGDGEEDAVAALTRLALLADAARQPPRSWTVLVAGLVADKASVKAWRQERWWVPETLLEDASRRNSFRLAMEEAEDYGRQLDAAAWTVAMELLGGSERADKKEARLYADAMPTASSYWGSLESAFQGFLRRLGEEEDHGRTYWRQSIEAAVRTSAQATYVSLGRDAKSLKAWAKTVWRFDRLVLRLKDSAEENTEHPAEVVSPWAT